ncbi:MAG: hypothetical protein NC818_00755 [Candidatus Omnitrophica bacterium]|nr:hypothetical protein [Candidatus Omnitrophota bacterium]
METNDFQNKEGIVRSLGAFIIVSVVVVVVVSFIIYKKSLLGPVLIGLGLLPLIWVKFSGRSVKSIGADIVFGAIDTSLLGVAALIGANFAGTLGAVVGGAVGDVITDGIAGLFEGRISSTLRRYGIEEARTPLSSSMGKMSGCLVGIGVVLTIAWTILRLKM